MARTLDDTHTSPSVRSSRDWCTAATRLVRDVRLSPVNVKPRKGRCRPVKDDCRGALEIWGEQRSHKCREDNDGNRKR